ncbi:hypothetical protein G6N82_10400 [Altererythrobacter sp. BO-6]|uniref:hypothetical protein n=1 Tax=Altererythrobacter sp. BO-6 TaxID=2604537 RepID=UPI0013E191B0|nr:hypothetical protein [Altererythrobacter sp. BO-6]QIG54506.1 hypothetical protein G6N82_10400 [Altererythrobacter sp. BO-6]
MQERYLGDSHDFIKYALLRQLNDDLSLRLGVNWYLARPENVDRPGNNDGEKRHHLKGGVWRTLDPDLFDLISQFEDPAARRIDHIAEWGLLPRSTAYHSESICSSDRQVWHANGLQALKDCGLVFLDPDNGFEVPSMTSRTAPKYALYSEAADYVRMGKVVVGIQFARQCDPIARAHEVRDRLLDVCGTGAILPVVRGRVAPNILFVTVAPPDLDGAVRTSIKRFCDKSEKVELVA